MSRSLTLSEVKQRLKPLQIRLLGRAWHPSRQNRFRCLVCGRSWKKRHLPMGCRRCADRRTHVKQHYDIETIRQKLKRKMPMVQILSKTYGGNKDPLDVRCRDCGHGWTTHWNALHNGRGCPECNTNKPQTVEGIRSALRKVKSVVRLLSTTYRDLHSPLKLQCRQCQHKWALPWNVLRHNLHKCPTCHPHRHGASEAAVRRTIERLTGWKFPKARPDWLQGRSKGMGGARLELDGYNERHRVAFEYQGFQHYKAAHWGGNKALGTQKLRDMRKRVQCLRHGVTLICVPYWKTDVEAFIRQKLTKAGVL